MIRSRNTQGALRTQSGTFWRLPVSATAATYHLNAGTLNTQVVGGSPAGFAAFYTRVLQTLFITPAFSGLSALTLQIQGLNQFNEPVSELLVFSSATAAQTTMCYARVTSVTIAAMTGTPAAGDTVSIGYSTANPGVPLLAKLDSTGSMKFAACISQTTAASQPTFTAFLAPTWRIQATVNAVTAGDIIVYVDPEDAGL